jgi:hypothetical protein
MASAPRILPLSPMAAVLLGLAVVSTGIVFVWNVWPVLTYQARPSHPGHWGWVMLHGLTGTVMLITGPLNLYVGETRRWFGWHRHIGCSYIGAGYTAALAALVVNAQNPHGSVSIAVSTSLLALTWMWTASMGWRTGARRQWAAHRAWMIRSYVLVWSFVFCRIAQRGQLGDGLGPDGSAILVWLTWLVPLLACEIGLRWRATGRAGGGNSGR